MKKNNLITFLLFLYSFIAYAQSSLMQDYKGLINYINTKDNLAYDGQYLYYASPEASIPEHVETVRVVKDKKKLYMKFGNSELLIIGKKAVMIDHEQKVLRVRDNLDLPTIMNFSQLDAVEKYDGFKSEKFFPQEGITGLRFSNPKFSKTAVELLYRPDINMITFAKMIFDVDGENADAEWNRKKIEASFYNHQLKGVKFPYAFSDFFSSKGKKIIGVKKCKGYQVI